MLSVKQLGWVAALGLIPLLQISLASAQDNSARTTGQRTHNLDRYFAQCLTMENDNEVQVAKLAASKSQRSDVKKFAEMLESDHEKFIKDLERFAGTELQSWREHRSKDSGEPRREAAATSARTNPDDLHGTFFTIKKEMADQCLASARKELGSKSGHEFDECFIGMQVGGHMFMMDQLKVLERHASPELQPLLRKGLDTTQAHLEKAKSIMKTLKDEHSKTAEK